MKNKAFKKPEIISLEVERVKGFTLVESSFRFHETSPHGNESLCIAHTTSGWDHLECGHFSGPIAPGAIVVIPPELIHFNRAGMSEVGDVTAIYFPSDYSDPKLRQLKELVISSSDLALVFERAAKELKSLKSTKGCRNLFNAVWEIHMAAAKQIDESKASRRSASKFSQLRAFKDSHGCTPGEFERQKNVRAAAEFLLSGAFPVDAALKAGFYDQSHLNRHFLKIYGVTPVEFQKRNSR